MNKKWRMNLEGVDYNDWKVTDEMAANFKSVSDIFSTASEFAFDAVRRGESLTAIQAVEIALEHSGYTTDNDKNDMALVALLLTVAAQTDSE